MTSKTSPTDGATSSPSIWNPNVAANWCLIFTPAFGAYLHTLNWRALGEKEQAAKSMKWFYVAIALLVLYAVMAVAIPNPKAAEGLSRLVGFVFLLSWYFSSARSQANYVKEKFGTAYIRLSWGKPLGYALAGLLGYIAFSFIVGLVGAVLT